MSVTNQVAQPACSPPAIEAPDLSQYKWIVVNSSAGKDSQASLEVVMETCHDQDFPIDKVVVSHQDLQNSEWEGTTELVHLQAERHNLEVIVSRYRDKHGVEKTLLDYVRERGKWPSSQARYCTSEYKRAPGNRTLTALFRRDPGNILQVFGLRAEESPRRANKKCFSCNHRASSLKREVTDWLPIHQWTTQQVWDRIKKANSPHHRAYDIGMSRLSCQLCIFAPRSALIIAGRDNPQLLDNYCEVETLTNHTFQDKLSLHSIREAIQQNEEPEKETEQWNM